MKWREIKVSGRRFSCQIMFDELYGWIWYFDERYGWIWYFDERYGWIWYFDERYGWILNFLAPNNGFFILDSKVLHLSFWFKEVNCL